MHVFFVICYFHLFYDCIKINDICAELQTLFYYCPLLICNPNITYCSIGYILVLVYIVFISNLFLYFSGICIYIICKISNIKWMLRRELRKVFHYCPPGACLTSAGSATPKKSTYYSFKVDILHLSCIFFVWICLLFLFFPLDLCCTFYHIYVWYFLLYLSYKSKVVIYCLFVLYL